MFSLCIFIETFFCTVFTLFCKFSYLDQFYSFTCIIHLHRFYYNVYPSHGKFFNVLPPVFLQKYLVCYSFIFLQIFRYLDQFYSFTLAILLYHFLTTMFIGHTCKFFKFLPLYFYRNKFSLMRTPILVETFENMKL